VLSYNYAMPVGGVCALLNAFLVICCGSNKFYWYEVRLWP